MRGHRGIRTPGLLLPKLCTEEGQAEPVSASCCCGGDKTAQGLFCRGSPARWASCMHGAGGILQGPLSQRELRHVLLTHHLLV